MRKNVQTETNGNKSEESKFVNQLAEKGTSEGQKKKSDV